MKDTSLRPQIARKGRQARAAALQRMTRPPREIGLTRLPSKRNPGHQAVAGFRAARVLDLDATTDSAAATSKLSATHSMVATSALAMDTGLGVSPATAKKTPPMTATPKAALICKAEL